MRMIKTSLLILLILTLALMLIPACENDEDDDDNDDSDDDDDDGEQVWEDPKTGLVWQVQATAYEQWWHARDYCKDLDLGGDSDWRLPTVGELRSIIRGCSASETGGACQITDDCIDPNACGMTNCRGCDGFEGPGLGGVYWAPDLAGSEYSFWYWTVTRVTLRYEKSFFWKISFKTAKFYWDYDWEVNMVRCVRN